MFKNQYRFIVVLILLYFLFSKGYSQVKSFPTAEGFGRFAWGGRGGKVIEVTNLNDSGKGSFREAVNETGARTVVFRVSGTITLKSKLFIQEDSLTIAGQTAPGDGICIKRYPINVNANQVIIRYLRIRLGDEVKQEEDAISIIGQSNVMIDHCSFSWGNDEVATMRDNVNTTMQWCIISESLNHSWHHKGDHGYGGIWGGMGATFHHNLLAHHSSRNPRFNGSRYHKRPEREVVDFRNNVTYNWGFNSAYGGEGGKHNIINNYYKAGPGTLQDSLQYRIVEPWDGTSHWYVDGNFVFGFPAISQNNWAGGIQGKFIDNVLVSEPFPAPEIQFETAQDAMVSVLDKAGATFPKRDAVDTRIVHEVKTGTAPHNGIWGINKGIIDSQRAVGGWPVLESQKPSVDTDHDGMPDKWEKMHDLDPKNPDDKNLDCNGDGYTNLEKYLNALTNEYVGSAQNKE